MSGRFWIVPALVLLTLSVFAQVRNFDFVNYDDPLYVTDNQHVLTGLIWDNIVWSFSGQSAKVTGNWSPLTWLSLMLDAQLFGTGPAGFHLTNVALHIATMLLLFAALNEMTRAFWNSAFVAALFAIHPLHVQSVAWVSERKDVLSILFGVLAIWWYAKSVGRQRKSWYWLSLGAFVLSLMAKQMLVTLPFLLLLLDYWPLKRLSSSLGEGDSSPESSPLVTTDGREGAGSGPVGWGLVREKVPYLLISLLFCAIAIWGQQAGGNLATAKAVPMGIRCLNSISVYAIYLWKTIWPVNLAVYYPYPKHSLIAEAAIAGLVLASLTVLAILVRQRRPYLLVGWLWYLGTLVPVIGIFPVGRLQQMADRYMYFPMIGLLIAVAWMAPSLTSARWWRERVLPGCAIASVAAFAVIAHQQTAYWRDTGTLFTHTLKVVESSVAHMNLGVMLADRRQFSEAIKHYQRAISLDPKDAIIYVNLGNVFRERRQLKKAIVLYQRAIDLNPAAAEVYLNLGNAFLELRQSAMALASYRRMIDLDPTDARPHLNLGNLFSGRRRFTEAIAFYQRAIDLDPTNPLAHNNLGYAIIEERRAANSIDRQCLSQAIEYYQRSVELDPHWDVSQINLANAIVELQWFSGEIDPEQLAIAITHYERAITLSELPWKANLGLGRLYLRMGRRQLAVQHLRLAVQSAPASKEAQDLLRKAISE